jgi:hypothetical protein
MPILFFPTWSEISVTEGLPGVAEEISEVLPVEIPEGSPTAASSAKTSLGTSISVSNAIKSIARKIVLFLLEIPASIMFSFKIHNNLFLNLIIFLFFQEPVLYLSGFK